MDVVVGILLLAALFLIYKRLHSTIGGLLDSVRIRAKQHLFMRGEYAEGQMLVSYQIVFNSGVDSSSVREGIFATIQPVSSPSVIKPSFLVEDSSDDLIILQCGNKLQTFFKGALTVTKTEVGVEGSWTIISWMRHDGIVAAREPMKQIVRHIHTGVLNVDPGATFGVVPMQRSPRIVKSYDLQDSVIVDYVQDFEAGLPVVS